MSFCDFQFKYTKFLYSNLNKHLNPTLTAACLVCLLIMIFLFVVHIYAYNVLKCNFLFCLNYIVFAPNVTDVLHSACNYDWNLITDYVVM